MIFTKNIIIAELAKTTLELSKSSEVRDQSSFSTIWLPQSITIKTLVLDVDYCESLKYRMGRLLNQIKVFDLGLAL